LNLELRIKILELKVPTSSLIRIFPKEKEKKTTYKSRKKEKKKARFSGMRNGLVKVFDSKILPDIHA
jgi:hypothetical protein